jgi:hypothetical protein
MTVSAGSQVYEGSRGIAGVFPSLYRDAVLFVLPPGNLEVDDDPELPTSIDVEAKVAGAVVEALGRMALPYSSIAIYQSGAADGVISEQTSVYEIFEGTLVYQTRFRIGDHRAMYTYLADYDLRDSRIWRVRPNASLLPIDQQMMDSIGIGSLRQLRALLDALTSIAHSVVEERVSRQVARATGEPRTRYTIYVREHGSDGPTAKQTFASIVRIVHAVRGHMRTDHRTGEKRIKVRPHLRGRGDAVQIKDYIIRPSSDGTA